MLVPGGLGAQTTGSLFSSDQTGHRASAIRESAAQGIDARPNIVLINLDDATRDSVEIDFLRNTSNPFFPNLKQLALEGNRFSNCHCAVPLCNPSRVCLFTGQYAHKTQIRGNSELTSESRGTRGGALPFRQLGPYGDSANPYVNNEIGVWMRQAGYHTIHVGKYLHAGYSPGVGQNWPQLIPPGWENFYTSFGNSYFATTFFRDGKIEIMPDLDPLEYPVAYRTEVETIDATNLIRDHFLADDQRPFFLYFAPLASHAESSAEFELEEVTPNKGMVDNRYKSHWPNLKQIREANFDEVDVSDKPAAVQAYSRLDSKNKNSFRNDYLRSDLDFRRRTLSLRNVDQFLLKLRNVLSRWGELDNTIIILTSDNGYSLGQHRLFGKNFHYQDVSNVPLIVWQPTRFTHQDHEIPHLVSHIDIAPTILELAQAPIPAEVQGKSFLPVLDGRFSGSPLIWNSEGVLIESAGIFQERQQVTNATFSALRFFDAVYVEWANGDKEYYKLSNDPLQLKNKYSSFSESLKSVLANRMAMAKSEMPEPATYIETPLTPNDVFWDSTTLSGFAEHKTDLSEVRLEITENNGGLTRFWDGSAWRDEPTQVNAELATTESVVTNWTYRFAPESEGVHRYQVTAIGVGRDGQVETTPTIRDFSIDASQPFCALTRPLIGETALYGETIKLEGTAQDDLGIRVVRIVIKKGNQYWNGTDWQSSAFNIEVPIDPPQGVMVQWTYDFRPPENSGAAKVYIRPVTNDSRYDPVPLIVPIQWSR